MNSIIEHKTFTVQDRYAHLLCFTWSLFVPKFLQPQVERTFSWIEKNRRLTRINEKTDISSKSFIYLAMSRLMLKSLSKKEKEDIGKSYERFSK